MDNGLLQLLGRRHSADGAIEAFQTARDAGFDNVNLDLMYGLPHQTLTQWEDTIARLATLEPEHISLYALTLEEGTPMRLWADQGKIPEPDPDVAADMYALARQVLAESGYHHYEISNWAKPERQSQHNLIYWRNEPYLGVGPGAHSRLGEYRFWTVLAPREYASMATSWSPSLATGWTAFGESELGRASTVDGWEHIDPDTACSETMFLGLRLLDGLDLSPGLEGCWTGSVRTLRERDQGTAGPWPATAKGRHHSPGRIGVSHRQPGVHPVPQMTATSVIYCGNGPSQPAPGVRPERERGLLIICWT